MSSSSRRESSVTVSLSFWACSFSIVHKPLGSLGSPGQEVRSRHHVQVGLFASPHNSMLTQGSIVSRVIYTSFCALEEFSIRGRRRFRALTAIPTVDGMLVVVVNLPSYL